MARVHSKTIEKTTIERIDYNMSVKPELKGVMVDRRADGGSGEEKLDGQRRVMQMEIAAQRWRGFFSE